MKDLNTRQNPYRGFHMKAILAAAAIGALIAGMPAADAADQQATGAEMDYSLSLRAANQGHDYPNAFNQAPGYSAGPYNPNGPRLHSRRIVQ